MRGLRLTLGALLLVGARAALHGGARPIRAVRPRLIVTRTPPPTALLATEAAALFGNVRIPAALVAGAALPLGFSVPFPAKSDRQIVRALKILNVGVGFVAVQSELLSIVMSTNAINSLTAGEEFIGSSRTLLQLFTNNKTLLTFFVGSYVHFMLGVFGLVVMCGIRGYFAVGSKFGSPLLLLTGAIFTRLIALINRGTVCRNFGQGNFLILLANFFRRFTFQTIGCRRWFDMISLAFLCASGLVFLKRSGAVFGTVADDDGDGVVTKAELGQYFDTIRGDLKDAVKRVQTDN